MSDLNLKVTGDLIVDCHHTIEDVGIKSQEVAKKAQDKKSIRRYGDIILPMDSTLYYVRLIYQEDHILYLSHNSLPDMVGYFDTQMVKEFSMPYHTV